MQDFAPNAATVHFLQRETTARLCADLLALLQRFRERRPGQVVTLRYEDLVADFHGEVARVLAAVGLDWDDAVAEYAERAGDGGMVTTPSYAQVTRGLYSSAIGRWQRYRPWLHGFDEHLGPWLGPFGYD